MLARHAWNADFADTLMLTYYAKRKAEVAPGVGKGTDMIIVGPGVNSIARIGHVIDRLDKEYERIIRAEGSAFERGKSNMRTYVDELTQQAQATATDTSAGQQAPPKTDGRASSADEPKAGGAEKTS
jgi:hypothetical protein